MKSQNLQSNLRTANAQNEREREATRRAVRTGEERLKPITELFPCMENAKENIDELRTMGVGDNDIRLLLTGKEITYSGFLYDRGTQKKASGQGRENRHSQKQVWQHDHLAERFSLQGIFQTAMDKTTEDTRIRHKQGCPYVIMFFNMN